MRCKSLNGVIALAVLLMFPWNAGLMAGVPQVKVSLVLVDVSGDTTRLSPGDQAPAEFTAPLKVEFISSLQSDDGNDYILFPEWKVTRTCGDDSEDYLKRQDSETAFEFTDYGLYKVEYAWSYRERNESGTTPGDEVASMSFEISDSEIRLFNAFSPNGDGINDVYRIYVRSVVSMKIAIFNRWGQTIRTISGPLDEILPSDAVPESDGGFLFECWDGTFGGNVVDDGVYFINVQAVGAGGKKYEKKSDINVLKGLGL